MRLGAWMPISWVFPCAYNLGSQDRREKDIVGVKDFFPLSTEVFMMEPGKLQG